MTASQIWFLIFSIETVHPIITLFVYNLVYFFRCTQFFLFFDDFHAVMSRPFHIASSRYLPKNYTGFETIWKFCTRQNLPATLHFAALRGNLGLYFFFLLLSVRTFLSPSAFCMCKKKSVSDTVVSSWNIKNVERIK